MKQADPLELVEAGTLARPGPVGRLVRVGLGVVCLYVLWQVVRYADAVVAQPFSHLPNLALMILAPICIFNYVVNIGFTRSWGRRPLIVSLVVLLVSAVAAVGWSGSPDHLLFGAPLAVWLAYFYAHLGVSFVLAGLLATPGCEMRAIPELIGRVRGAPVAEHPCPAAFITKLDAWERRRATRS